jgi:hypothetical protein
MKQEYPKGLVTGASQRKQCCNCSASNRSIAVTEFPRAFGPADHAGEEERVAKIFLRLFLYANHWGNMHYRQRAFTSEGSRGYKRCCGPSSRVEAPVIVSLLMSCQSWREACHPDAVTVGVGIALGLVCRLG